MNIRTLFSGLLLFSGRTLLVAPEVINKLANIAEKDIVVPVVNQPALAVPNIVQTQRCAENKPVKKVAQKLFLEELDLDDIVSASEKLKSNNPRLAKKSVSMIRKILIEILENEIQLCKFKTIVEAPERHVLVKGILASFTIEAFDESEYPYAGAWQMEKSTMNKIKILAALFDESHHMFLKSKAEIAAFLTHEIHHAFVGANIYSKSAESINSRFSLKSIFSRAEANGAPYANKDEKKQFSEMLGIGEKRVVKLIKQWIDVRNDVASAETKKIIEKLKKEVSDFNPPNRLVRLDKKSGYCPLRELLEWLTQGDSIIAKTYEVSQRQYEKDAWYHQFLTPYPELFKALFKELLAWHENHNLLAYKQCLRS